MEARVKFETTFGNKTKFFNEVVVHLKLIQIEIRVFAPSSFPVGQDSTSGHHQGPWAKKNS